MIKGILVVRCELGATSVYVIKEIKGTVDC